MSREVTTYAPHAQKADNLDGAVVYPAAPGTARDNAVLIGDDRSRLAVRQLRCVI